MPNRDDPETFMREVAEEIQQPDLTPAQAAESWERDFTGAPHP